jgi:hypothetical protein
MKLFKVVWKGVVSPAQMGATTFAKNKNSERYKVFMTSSEK